MKPCKIIAKISRSLQSFFRRYPENVTNIRDYLIEHENHAPQIVNEEPRVVIEGVYDPLYLGLFGIIASDLKKRTRLHVDFLWVHSISNAVGVGVRQSLLRSQVFSLLRCRQWYRAYSSFVDGVAYFSNVWLDPISELRIYYQARRIHKEIQKLPNFSTYQIDGVMVGDLIIDTYLRFRPAAEFVISDPFVRTLISQSLRDIQKADRYFSKVKPLIYLSGYTTYIQHGIPVRVALKNGIQVRCFSGPLNFGKKLTNVDFYHSSNCDSYRKGFEQLDDKCAKRNEAELELIKRFSGSIDIATNYMKVSAYANTDVDAPDVSGHVIVFLHDFYDSPHVYKDLIFNDFWSWVVTTIEVLRAEDICFSIKPHPNQIPESEQVFKSLVAKYPNLKILSQSISNELLAESGIICGVTVYGTVAHELAYFGIPTIACARHPHYQYDFCRTAGSLSEYREFLRTPSLLPTSTEKMREQALEFFYMHNLRFSESDGRLREKVASYFAAFSGTLDPHRIVGALEELRSCVSYECLIDDLIENH